MARTFAYLRVSTSEQLTDNQLREIEAAGFMVEKQRVEAETISGSTSCKPRTKRVLPDGAGKNR